VEGEGQGNGLLAWEFGKHRGSLGRGDAFDERVARDAIARLREGPSGQLRYDDAPGGPIRVFVDTYPSQPTIVIFGGVHICVALTHLAKAAGGFRVIVVDARGAWATPERFPEADAIHAMHADDYLRQHPPGSNAYVPALSHARTLPRCSARCRSTLASCGRSAAPRRSASDASDSARQA